MLDIDECDIPAPVCQNSRVCENTFGGFDRQCLKGFAGEFCELAGQNGRDKSSSNTGLAVSVSLGCVVVLLLIVGAGYYWWNRKKRLDIRKYIFSFVHFVF